MAAEAFFPGFEFFEIKNSNFSAIITELNDGSEMFEDLGKSPMTVPGDDEKKYRGFVPWGEDNKLPYEIIDSVRHDEVLSQNKLFNTLTLYGSGIKLTNNAGEELTDKEIKDFFDYNRLPKYYLEQATDMKHFFFTVAVIILSSDGNKIVRLRHKEAIHTRFELVNPKSGLIENLFYANWKDDPKKDEIETIEVLDLNNPLWDLMVRMGRIYNDKGEKQNPTKTRKFAIVNMFPIPGTAYYPFAYWYSIFQSGWFDIKRLIPKGKKAKFKNGASVKYHVEINKIFWDDLCDQEGITDKKEKIERCNKEKENIKKFLTGIENSGKMWISGFYTSPDGKEVKYVRITNVDQGKEGGDWIEDSEEASNMICYADNIHPSMVGAAPGKSKGGFSGSVQRELFTMKQSLEKAYQDILLEPLFVIKKFNEWDDFKYDIPVITLTTLDKGKDAEENTLRENSTE
ncbi:MAG: hypothetical protein VB054_04835 [Petrimonas sp.]|jgi:hypothetical protein|nr:hypothetical protein [Petrimonas sp.]